MEVLIIVIIAILVFIIFRVNKIVEARYFTDSRDGKKYKIVKIGSQTWMAENLNYKTSDSKCYDNNEANGDTYGRLYDWATAKTECPLGWHLPSNEEWDVLIDYVGGRRTAGTKLKSKSGWNNDFDGNDGNGTDDYGFSALSGGSGYSDDRFQSVGYTGNWWSATEDNAIQASSQYMGYYSGSNVVKDHNYKSSLLSVRCVKD